MIMLDYQTDNPKWGWSGIAFCGWDGYAFTLGYLSNIAHYQKVPQSASNADIRIKIERNDEQGAWAKQGRIEYYGALTRLQTHFPDLFRCSSAGVGRATKRINSNDYALSLVNDYGFTLRRRPNGQLTADIYPPDSPAQVRARLQQHLQSQGLSAQALGSCLAEFDRGYHL